MKKPFILAFAFIVYYNFLFSQSDKTLIHSHNDYLQKEPLFTALSYPINALEIDVFWHKNQFIVSHIPLLLNKKPELEALYLKPMLENASKLEHINYILIDIKSTDQNGLLQLNHLIAKYDSIFQKRNNVEEQNKIKVILSGGINRQEICQNETLTYLMVDGNTADLDKNYDNGLMPLVSMPYSQYTHIEKIAIIKKAKEQQKYVRFWGVKNNKKTWNYLINLEVGVIGIDKINKFFKYQRATN